MFDTLKTDKAENTETVNKYQNNSPQPQHVRESSSTVQQNMRHMHYNSTKPASIVQRQIVINDPRVLSKKLSINQVLSKKGEIGDVMDAIVTILKLDKKRDSSVNETIREVIMRHLEALDRHNITDVAEAVRVAIEGKAPDVPHVSISGEPVPIDKELIDQCWEDCLEDKTFISAIEFMAKGCTFPNVGELVRELLNIQINRMRGGAYYSQESMFEDLKSKIVGGFRQRLSATAPSPSPSPSALPPAPSAPPPSPIPDTRPVTPYETILPSKVTLHHSMPWKSLLKDELPSSEEEQSRKTWNPGRLAAGIDPRFRLFDPGSFPDYEAQRIIDLSDLSKKHEYQKKFNPLGDSTKQAVDIKYESKKAHMKTNLLQKIYDECIRQEKNAEFNDSDGLLALALDRFDKIEQRHKDKLLLLARLSGKGDKLSPASFVIELNGMSSKTGKKPLSTSGSSDKKLLPVLNWVQLAESAIGGIAGVVPHSRVQDPGHEGMNCFFLSLRALGFTGGVADAAAMRTQMNEDLTANHRPQNLLGFVTGEEIRIYANARGIRVRIHIIGRDGTVLQSSTFGSAGNLYQLVNTNFDHFMPILPPA